MDFYAWHCSYDSNKEHKSFRCRGRKNAKRSVCRFSCTGKIELSIASALQFFVFALGEEIAGVSTIAHFTANIFEVMVFTLIL